MIRRTLQETAEFAARKHHPTPSEIYASMLKHWRIVITGVAMVLMTTVFVLHDHGVYPDVRQEHTHAVAERRAAGHAVRGRVEFDLAAAHGVPFRSDRPQTFAAELRGHGDSDGISPRWHGSWFSPASSNC